MDGGLRLSWLTTFLLIISLHNSGWVSGMTSQENQPGGRRKLASREGFLSLDCGIAAGSNYTDDVTGTDYTSDAEFVDTGIIHYVSKQYVEEGSTYQYFRSVRSFPDGKRNCYTLKVERSKYLIRARFRYGNYDDKNQLPTFKLYLGVDEWDTVNISDVSGAFSHEMLHKPITDQIDVCLVNTGKGTPFISVLELRPLNDSIYSPSEPGSLLLYGRWDFGSDEEIDYREKDDVYDRIWRSLTFPWTFPWEWEPISSSLVPPSWSTSDYKLPAEVMATAATPANESESFDFSIVIDDDPSQKLYIYMHFAEVEELEGQTREFTISVDDQSSFGGPLVPSKDNSETRHNQYAIGSTTDELSISLKSTIRSSFPPLINAIEVYTLKDFSLPSTQQNEVIAMKKIKSEYGVSRNWQGDPCLPMDYRWNGLACSSNTSPAIISLNLSSSNLSGVVNTSLFLSLKWLQSLDLSYNFLTGPVPESFTHFPSLTILNLTGNNLTGSVPQAVIDKFKDGILLGENPNLCQSDSCQGLIKKKRNFLILVTVLSGIGIIIAVAALAMIIRKFRRTENKTTTKKMPREYPKQGSMRTWTSEFTYAEIAKITNNFSQTIGRGGSGLVFLGNMGNGTQVAVKMLSESSRQGTKALQAEVTLLTRVHHKNLVSLLGYCNDGKNMALIYEYMSEGNLENKLSGRDTTVLNWKKRLQIGADAAQGLEYLHNGCKPPIVHRDMKSSNILLNENLQAKISDFGISRDLVTQTGACISSTGVAGSPGYLDPEYQSTGVLNKKSDVYSFGIVLLELITGQAVIKNPECIHILRWVHPLVERGDIQSIVDPRLLGDFNPSSAWKALEMALSCVASTRTGRPDMSQVAVELKECLEIEVAASRKIAGVLEESPLVHGIEMGPHAR